MRTVSYTHLFATLASQVPGWVEQLKVIAMELIEKYDLQNIDLSALEATTFDKLLNTLQGCLLYTSRCV